MKKIWIVFLILILFILINIFSTSLGNEEEVKNLTPNVESQETNFRESNCKIT